MSTSNVEQSRKNTERVRQILSQLDDNALQAMGPLLPKSFDLGSVPVRQPGHPIDRTSIIEFLDQAARRDNLPKAAPFDFLRSLDVEEVISLLSDELPETNAAILIHLDPEFSARTVTGMPMEQRILVIHAMAKMSKPSRIVAEELDFMLREKRLRSDSEQNREGIDALKRMIVESEPSTAIRLSASIERTDERLVDKLSIYSDAG